MKYEKISKTIAVILNFVWIFEYVYTISCRILEIVTPEIVVNMCTEWFWTFENESKEMTEAIDIPFGNV